MIHLIDGQNDNIPAVITQKNVLSNTHKQTLKDYLETFDFSTFGDKTFVKHLAKRNRIIIPDEDQGYKEFIIHNLIKEKGNKHRAEVYTVGSYLELKKAKIIEPTTLTEYTATMHVSFATNNTEWRPGIIESDQFRTLTISTATNPFAFLKRIANEFGLELRFRVETDGNRVTGRYVDLLERNGQWRGREITFGKDLQKIRRKEDFSNIYTALKCYGPEREDGTRLEVLVEDEDALQRWGRPDPITGELQHLIDTYEPQSSRQEMSIEELTQYGRTELNKRINSVVEYEAGIVDLENVPGMENKKIRFGDTIKIKDIHFNPALYLEARVHTQERDIFTKANKKVELGDYIEYTEEEVNAIWQQLQKAIQAKISLSDLMEVTYTKDIIDDKDIPGNDAKNKLDNDVGDAVIETTTGAQDKADQAESESNNYTDLKEQAIRQDLADKAGLEYVDGQLALKADGDIVQTIDNTVNNLQGVTDGLLSDVADHATELQEQGGKITTVETDLDTVEGDLNIALTDLSTLNGVVDSQGTQINANTTAISLKAEQTVVEGMQDEFNALSIGGRNLQQGIFELGHPSGGSGHRYSRARPIKPVKIKHNTAYTISIQNPQKEFRFGYYLTNENSYPISNVGFVGWFDLTNEHLTLESNNESYLILMFKQVNEDENDVIVDIDSLNESEIQVEKGNKATDWTPAPEDIQADITAVGTRVSDLDAEVEVIAGQVELKAERSELETVEGDVSTLSNEVGNLTVAYDGIEASVSSLETVTDGHSTDLTNVSASLGVMQDEISSKVSETYVTGAIADIEIGGRNLIIPNEKYYRSSSSSIEVEGYTIIVNGSSSQVAGFIIEVEPNTQYTLSYISDISSGTRVYEHENKPDSQNSEDFGEYLNYYSNYHSGLTFTTTSNTNYLIVGVYASGLSPASFVEWKLEKGNKATDWTPAPEDTQAEIDSVYSYAESEITQLAGRVDTKAEVSVVDGLETRTTTAEQSINALEGQISSKIDDGEARSIFLQEADSFTFDADQINLVGAVSVLSDITGDLGTINAGTINGVNINGSAFNQNGTNGSISLNDNGFIFEGTNSSIEMNIQETSGFHGDIASMAFIDNGGHRAMEIFQHYTDGYIRTDRGLILESGLQGMTLDASRGASDYGVNVIGGLRVMDGFLRAGAVDTYSTHLYGRPSAGGEFRVTTTGTTGSYENIRAGKAYFHGFIEHGGAIDNTLGGGSHHYIRTDSNGQIRATVNGSTSNYVPVRADSFPTGSSEKVKENISVFDGNALDIINNSVIYDYNRKATGVRELGFIIEREMPDIVKYDSESINGYSHRSLNTKGIQELDGNVTDLKVEVQMLKEQIKQIEETIK